MATRHYYNIIVNKKHCRISKAVFLGLDLGEIMSCTG